MLQILQRLTPSCRTLVGTQGIYSPVRSAWRNTRHETVVDSVDGGFRSAFPIPHSKFRSTSRAYSTPSNGPSVVWEKRAHRVVESFSPQRLVSMNHPVINISEKTRVRIHAHVLGEATTASLIFYVATRVQGTFKVTPFPPNTVGVFYYHQSQTSPTHLGELRFRLCPDISDFEQGDDLRLPSGNIWHINSRSLYLSDNCYKGIHQRLVRDGLLDGQLYHGIPRSMLRHLPIPLKSLSQPFIVDLADSKVTAGLVTSQSPPTVLKFYLKHPFQDGSRASSVPLFGGRAVVRFEPYPKSTLPERSTFNPLLTLRCLELLTPVKRLSDSDGCLNPIPGQLFMKTYRTYGHIPWYFSSTNAATRKVITEWIGAQSSSST